MKQRTRTNVNVCLRHRGDNLTHTLPPGTEGRQLFTNEGPNEGQVRADRGECGCVTETQANPYEYNNNINYTFRNNLKKEYGGSARENKLKTNRV